MVFGQFQINWQQSFGSMGSEHAYDIVKTSDGYLVVGSLNTGSGQVTCEEGSSMWLLKLDDDGNLQWQGCYDSVGTRRMVKAIDNNTFYYLIGVGPIEAYPSIANLGFMKIDSAGMILWHNSFGNSIGILTGDEDGTATKDGGVIGTAQIDSKGGDITNWYGSYDAWVIKLDSLGNKEWDVTLGSPWVEHINGIIQTDDGGYLAGLYGAPRGEGGTLNCNVEDPLNSEAIAVKIDSLGNIEWHRCYGGSQGEHVITMLKLEDGYLLGCGGSSTDGDMLNSGWHYGWNHLGTPHRDVWLVKIDFDGNIIWQKCYGGSDDDYPKKIFQTEDGGYMIFANTQSHNGDIVYNPSDGDQASVWVFKIDSIGQLLWQQCIGGHAEERVYGVAKNSDYNYVVAGEMFFSPSGDVNCSNFEYGSRTNYWVFSITDTITSITETRLKPNEVKIYPNPAKSIINIDFQNAYNFQNINIDIIDINGKTVLETSYDSAPIKIDIKQLNKGLYLIKIQNHKTIITKKIIIQ